MQHTTVSYGEKAFNLTFHSEFMVTMHDAEGTMYVLTEQQQQAVDHMSTFGFLRLFFYNRATGALGNVWPLLRSQMDLYGDMTAIRIIDIVKVDCRRDDVILVASKYQNETTEEPVGLVRVLFQPAFSARHKKIGPLSATFMTITTQQFVGHK
jgi:hypothetical protein